MQSKRGHVFWVTLCITALISGRVADAGQAAAGRAKAAAAQQEAPNYGPAQGCVPPTLPKPQPLGVRIPPLPSGQRPNFIVVLTDDQGFDDLGAHQPQQPGGRPQWVSTPNLDKFLSQSMEFRNFYVSPMCSQSRAELLTGRSYQRTGTMLINGGYDYINRDESTIGNVMADGGYKTAHFGKWHNGRTLGYEPWEMGFQESWLPTSHVHLDNIMRHNGVYVQTKGLMEQDLMDTLLSYLTRREQDGAPFITYYAPHAIHQGFLRPGQGPRWQRPAPEPYASKYRTMQPKLAGDTAQVWGMLEYMDDVLGRLFDWVEHSKLRDNTYVLVMGDNGAELFPEERKGMHRQRRMPSGMQGFKKSAEEGGIRNFLAVKGPGVPAGVLDFTLTSIQDILPTIADLAHVSSDHLPWDGMSLANVLQPNSNPAGSSTTAALSSQQSERVVVEMSPHCWSPDTVPELGADRKVVRSQQLLDFERGGLDGKGFQHCLGLRYKNYKWLGESNRVFRIEGDSHIELPCNEVFGEEKDRVVAKLSGAARQWWSSIIAGGHSFEKPTFQLGLNGWSVTNILPDGAHERTPGRIELLPNGAAGFSQVGDSMCFKLDVLTGGTYKVQILYTSKAQAQFRLAVGPYRDIQDGKAPALQARLPETGNMRGIEMGALHLQPSGGKPVEACLTLVATTKPGSPVFDNLSNIRFSLDNKQPANTRTAAPGTAAATPNDAQQQKEQLPFPTKSSLLGGGGGIGQQNQQQQQQHGKKQQQQRQRHDDFAARSEPTTTTATSRAPPEHPGSLYAYDWIMFDSELEAIDQELAHPFLGATAGMKRAERDAYAAAAARRAKEGLFLREAGQPGANSNSSSSSSSSSGGVSTAAAGAVSPWEELRRTYLWPDGQQGQMESLFSPYESEGIYTCSKCQPDV